MSQEELFNKSTRFKNEEVYFNGGGNFILHFTLFIKYFPQLINCPPLVNVVSSIFVLSKEFST